MYTRNIFFIFQRFFFIYIYLCAIYNFFCVIILYVYTRRVCVHHSTRLKNKLSTSVAYIGGKMDVCASTGQQTVYI